MLQFLPTPIRKWFEQGWSPEGCHRVGVDEISDVIGKDHTIVELFWENFLSHTWVRTVILCCFYQYYL